MWASFLSFYAMISTSIASVLAPRQTSNLRIVALGDSITFGWWSNDLNGYRQDLAEMLQHTGYNVEYIGFQQSGSMVNNRSEGYPGDTILQIMQDGFEVFNGTFATPNVVLLHAGTNDANNAVQDALNSGNRFSNEDIATKMINDLKTLIDGIFAKAPNTYDSSAVLHRDGSIY